MRFKKVMVISWIFCSCGRSKNGRDGGIRHAQTEYGRNETHLQIIDLHRVIRSKKLQNFGGASLNVPQ